MNGMAAVRKSGAPVHFCSVAETGPGTSCNRSCTLRSGPRDSARPMEEERISGEQEEDVRRPVLRRRDTWLVVAALLLVPLASAFPVDAGLHGDLDPVKVRLGLGIFLCIGFLWVTEALPLAATALLVPVLGVLAEDATGGSLDIGAEYQEAVVNYVAYRCNTKDSEFAAPAVATAFYQAFEASLGIKTTTQAAASPNQPGNSV